MAHPRKPQIQESPSHYDQLEFMLRNPDTLGAGYEFEHFRIDSIGMEVDALRFSPYGIVKVELRQATNQPKGLYAPLPPESRNTRPQPFSRDVRIGLWTMHPSLTFSMQHEDRYRWSTIASAWRMTPQSEMKFDMVDFETPVHGPLTPETRLSQLELVLGRLPVSTIIPEHTYFVEYE